MISRSKARLLVGIFAVAGVCWLAGLTAAAEAAPEISGNLGAHPYHYQGKAPKTFMFIGKIQVKGVQKQQPVTVGYQFAFSDGSTQPGGELTFKRDGAKQIRTSWTFGTPGDKGDGWAELKLTAPEERSICKANFSYEFK